MSEEKKTLRCKYCGGVIPGPYIKALDGNISHPECYNKEMNRKEREKK